MADQRSGDPLRQVVGRYRLDLMGVDVVRGEADRLRGHAAQVDVVIGGDVGERRLDDRGGGKRRNDGQLVRGAG